MNGNHYEGQVPIACALCRKPFPEDEAGNRFAHRGRDGRLYCSKEHSITGVGQLLSTTEGNARLQ